MQKQKKQRFLGSKKSEIPGVWTHFCKYMIILKFLNNKIVNIFNHLQITPVFPVFSTFFLPLFLCSSLSSCADMNTHFDCPMKPGVRCESLDQINARVDRGEIGKDLTHAPRATEPKRPSYVSTDHPRPSYYKDQPGSPPSSMSWVSIKHAAKDPVREPESVMRVWFAPFEDTEGNYHTESEVYSVVRPGFWVDRPVKAIHENDV